MKKEKQPQPHQPLQPIEQLDAYQLKWFDIVLQEYNSLRTEVSDSLKNQQSIINYGLTAIGVLIAFTANLWGKEFIVEMIYVFFVPFLCNLIILIWNGEVRRMSRAGQYIKGIEDKIDKTLSKSTSINMPALNWETYLRQPKAVEISNEKTNPLRKMFRFITKIFSFLFKKSELGNNKIKSNYIAIIIMFWILSILSILLAFGHNYSMYRPLTIEIGIDSFLFWIYNNTILISIYAMLFIVDILFFIYHYRYFQKAKK
jgi:hypothetical protein